MDEILAAGTGMLHALTTGRLMSTPSLPGTVLHNTEANSKISGRELVQMVQRKPFVGRLWQQAIPSKGTVTRPAITLVHFRVLMSTSHHT